MSGGNGGPWFLSGDGLLSLPMAVLVSISRQLQTVNRERVRILFVATDEKTLTRIKKILYIFIHL